VNTYLLVHRQPHGYTGTPEAAAAWEAWFGTLGDALVDKGNAVLSDRSAVGEAGPVLPLGGYTIVKAPAWGAPATQLSHYLPPRR
jgi:hypothetical protein